MLNQVRSFHSNKYKNGGRAPKLRKGSRAPSGFRGIVLYSSYSFTEKQLPEQTL